MTAGNPFDPTRYSLYLNVNSEYDPRGVGAEGVKELLSYLRDQVVLRREAVVLGYLKDNPAAVSELLPLDGISPDTTGAMYAVMTSCRDALLQLMPGHPSRFWEKYGRLPCEEGASPSGSRAPAGFFRMPNNNSEVPEPTDDWITSIDSLTQNGLYLAADRERFLNPPQFDSSYVSLRRYASAVGNWATSAFRLLNLMRFAHPLLLTPLPLINCTSGAGGCDFNMSYNSQMALGMPFPAPIDIFVDVRGALTCTELSGRKYGRLCVEWTALGGRSRAIMTAIRGGIPHPTQSKLCGFEERLFAEGPNMYRANTLWDDGENSFNEFVYDTVSLYLQEGAANQFRPIEHPKVETIVLQFNSLFGGQLCTEPPCETCCCSNPQNCADPTVCDYFCSSTTQSPHDPRGKCHCFCKVTTDPTNPCFQAGGGANCSDACVQWLFNNGCNHCSFCPGYPGCGAGGGGGPCDTLPPLEQYCCLNPNSSLCDCAQNPCSPFCPPQPCEICPDQPDCRESSSSSSNDTYSSSSSSSSRAFSSSSSSSSESSSSSSSRSLNPVTVCGPMLSSPETEIFDTGCHNTMDGNPPPGWYWDDQNDSFKTNLLIDDTMLITDNTNIAAYHLRIVIFPWCDGNTGPTINPFFSLNISCIGCGCDGCQCGLGDCESYEVDNGKWTPTGRGPSQGCQAGGGGGGGTSSSSSSSSSFGSSTTDSSSSSSSDSSSSSSSSSGLSCGNIYAFPDVGIGLGDAGVNAETKCGGIKTLLQPSQAPVENDKPGQVCTPTFCVALIKNFDGQRDRIHVWGSAENGTSNIQPPESDPNYEILNLLCSSDICPPALTWYVTSIAPGANHICISVRNSATQEDKILCWGDNSFGQCDVPVQPDQPSLYAYTLVDISCGEDHCCMLRSRTSLAGGVIEQIALCWGSSASNQTTVPGSLALWTSYQGDISRPTRLWCASDFSIVQRTSWEFGLYENRVQWGGIPPSIGAPESDIEYILGYSPDVVCIRRQAQFPGGAEFVECYDSSGTILAPPSGLISENFVDFKWISIGTGFVTATFLTAGTNTTYVWGGYAEIIPSDWHYFSAAGSALVGCTLCPTFTLVPSCNFQLDPWFQCSYAVTTSPTPPPFGADVVVASSGVKEAYAQNCCNGSGIECRVDFTPHFANASNFGCATWELGRTCNYNGTQLYFWRPLIRDCQNSSGSPCTATADADCPSACSPCCRLCFGVGTRLLMADGTSKSVEELRIGDLVEGVLFDGAQISAPSFTDLLGGWDAQVDHIYRKIARVTFCSLGFEKNRVTVGRHLVVSGDHPILVKNTQGTLSFVSAALLKNDSELVRKDGSSVSAGEIIAEERNLVTVFLELDGCSAVVANGIIAHVGTSAGINLIEDSGFDVQVRNLDSTTQAVVEGIIGPSEIIAQRIDSTGPNGNLETFDVNTNDDTGILAHRFAGQILPESCREICDCAQSCQTISGSGSYTASLIKEEVGSLPCCIDAGLESNITSVFLSDDNQWIFSSIAYVNSGIRGSLLVARMMSEVCFGEPKILDQIDDSDSTLPYEFTEGQEVVDGTVFLSWRPGGTKIFAYKFDGLSFTNYGSLAYSEESFSIDSLQPIILSDGSLTVILCKSDVDGSSLCQWTPSPTSATDMQVLKRLPPTIFTSLACIVRADGTVFVTAVGGDTINAFIGSANSENQLQLDSLPVSAPSAHIQGRATALFGAKDRESIVAISIDPISSTGYIQTARINRQSAVFVTAAESIMNVSDLSAISVSGLQGKFAISVFGRSNYFEFISQTGALSTRGMGGASSSAISVSKSHNLLAFVCSEYSRCPSCAQDDNNNVIECNTGAVVITNSGILSTGKQLISGCISPT